MSNDTSYARYTHDCEACRFLGQHDDADLYVCDGRAPTVIARFSSDGPEYASGKCFSYGSNAHLTEARFRAQAQGLLPYDLKEALFYCKESLMDDRVRDELRDQLAASEIGQVMAQLSVDGPAGTQALRSFIERGTKAYLDQFPDHGASELKRWVRSHVQQAWEWCARLSMPHPAQETFTVAAFT